MRIRRLIACSLLALAGCASYDDTTAHLSDFRHPWHAVPWVATSVVTYLPMMVLYAPFGLLGGEEWSNTHGKPFTTFVSLPATAVGGAFYVVGAPLELLVPDRHDAAERRAEERRAKERPRKKGAPAPVRSETP